MASGHHVPLVRLQVHSRVSTRRRTMNRRRFIQVAGLAGLTVLAPSFGSKKASAGSSKFDGPYWIMINAGGGWDPTLFCDPKGGSIDQAYTPDQKGKVGDIEYAPLKYTTDNDATT